MGMNDLESGEPTEPTEDQAHAEAVNEMFELHRDIGRRALAKAMAVLDQIDAADIPINVAVQLLKFGADLERRAVLGIEPEGEQDPFSALAGVLDGKPKPTPS
jgi:hypothetical protein